ncbi:MAG TPA: F0F1 ATP synthase subunit B [Candidatus Omnitrophota bacterium]|nr:F0F1 ATP synthase subunit B [Candidatus Omnitrophota bacterium]HPD85438.1 F0F1 ATP synthase subunit B [Candidatus Omnitrophota bacterium]HRZ04061.1 F0F1 ATP synthase subunit B [Candidatus Omnitrophota bacterium]
MELLKLLSANEIVAQLICFLLLFFILRAFAWKKFLKILDDRKERIASDFRSIEEAKAEIARIKADYDTRLNTIEETARARIQEAVSAGQALSRDIQGKARDDAQKILETAKENIKQELSKAKQELKTQVVDLTIAATERIIKEKLTKETDKKLIADLVSEIEKSS